DELIKMADIVQVINGEGQFEQDSVQQFVAANELAHCKTNYQVVAIMGPQSSGKSTLLNHVFGTSFTMMDALAGRGQTTKGIWLSKSPKVTDTTVLVMDLEGSDGRERGEDDTNFERQSALFALAVADVLLVNIWCHDVGRELASGKPLLKTIFQVNLKLFAPEPDRKRSVLLFVIRDKTKTPLPKLVEVLQADLERMWEGIAKPAAYQESKLTDFFEVQYAALSHFEERYEDFVADSVHLRRRFSPEADDSLVRGDEKLPGDSFALSIRNIWEVIRAQKDLNLPAHKVMVANVRCAEIAEDQLRAFEADQAWRALREAAAEGIVEGFGARASSLADSCIRGYEAEALYFDPSVRSSKLSELQVRLHALLQPPYQQQVAAQQAAVLAAFERDVKLALVEAIAGGPGDGKGGSGGEGAGGAAKGFMAAAAVCRERAVAAFTAAFGKHLRIEVAPWDGSAELAALCEALDAHLTRVRGEHMSQAVTRVEKQLGALLSGPVMGLLEVCAPGMWGRLHGVCREAATAAERNLMQALEGFDLSGSESESLSERLRARARSSMEGHVREAALTRLSRMKDRFQEVFSLDENRAPRMWGPRDDIPAIAQQARVAAASVLSQLAVMRPPPEEGRQGQADLVEAAVMQLARTSPAPASTSTSHQHDSADSDRCSSSASASTAAGWSSASIAATPGGMPVDMLSAAAWPGVEESCVLLHPHDVRTTWREFLSYSNVLVQQAQSAQQSNRLASNRMPPLWAIGMMLVLGWNEAMMLIFNPIYLLLGALGFLFLRSLYTELDVEREMSSGALPGAISLANKFAPACREVVRKPTAAFQDFFQSLTGRDQERRAAAYVQHAEGQSQHTPLHTPEGLTRRPVTDAPDSASRELTDLRRQEGKKDL
ncbi:hypothetical protein Agub_g3264, partial [Astrephomene gubernaculifera]